MYCAVGNVIVDRRCTLGIISMGGRAKEQDKAENPIVKPLKFHYPRINH